MPDPLTTPAAIDGAGATPETPGESKSDTPDVDAFLKGKSVRSECFGDAIDLITVAKNLERERDRNAAALKLAVESLNAVLAAAYPSPTEHPTMAKAWDKASRALAEIEAAATKGI